MYAWANVLDRGPQRPRKRTVGATVVLLLGTLLFANRLTGDQVRVHYTEGLSRGFMVLRTQDGTPIADGESSQVVKSGIVTSHLTFHFKDGSLYDDATTFTQHGNFHLIRNHVIQKGPSFKTQMESIIDTTTGRVTASYTRDNKPGNVDETLDLPADLANGLIFTLVKNMLSSPVSEVSYLALAPIPRLVKLIYTQQGREKLSTDKWLHDAVHFVMKVDIPGIAGVAASILKKEPPDTQIWVITDEAPIFAGSEGPLYSDGPIWKIELVSPTLPGKSARTSH